MGVDGAAVAVQVTAQAIKASGAIVRVEPDEFLKLLARSADPLVVTAPGGFLSSGQEYLFSYKGLVFFTNSPEPLSLPESAEVIAAQRIWMPAR